MLPEPQLMESMRAVGYTLPTSLADIIDNSISASCTEVWVDFSSSGERYVAISDDGNGMDTTETLRAMRLAGVTPLGERDRNDLGRFGLGLKTASLAQCRVLTVVSKKHGDLVAYRWDLDHLATTGTWSVLKLGDTDISGLPGVSRLLGHESGTTIVWQKLDQLTDTIGPDQSALDSAMEEAKNHLSLVFHRFIAGDGVRRVSVRMNDVELPPIDPFLKDHRGTQRGPSETVRIEGVAIRVQPFTLPFMNKISAADREKALLNGTTRDTQGFYIYRARRLVVWGTWFRLVPKAELSKLARVQVDIPNTLDRLWALDIKKSVAVPPPEVRRELRRITDKIIEPSRRVHTYRGRREGPVDDSTHLWRVVTDRTTFRYEINRRHPVIATLGDALGDESRAGLEALLAVAETTFPIQDAYNRLAEDATQAVETDNTIIDQAKALWRLYRLQDRSLDQFIQAFKLVEPFSMHNEFESACRKELV